MPAPWCEYPAVLRGEVLAVLPCCSALLLPDAGAGGGISWQAGLLQSLLPALAPHARARCVFGQLRWCHLALLSLS